MSRLAIVALAAWLGVMGFFSFVVAPVVFQTIDRAAAGRAVAAVLPWYYGCGITLSVLASLALARGAVRARAGRWRNALAALLAAVAAAALAWSAAEVLPRANEARRTHDNRAFVAAHRSAGRLNSVTLLAGIGALALAAIRRGARPDR